MAVDTRDKRASVIGFDGPYRFILPNPDVAAEDQGDRQQVSWKYRGILAGAPQAGARGRKVGGRRLRRPFYIQEIMDMELRQRRENQARRDVVLARLAERKAEWDQEIERRQQMLAQRNMEAAILAEV